MRGRQRQVGQSGFRSPAGFSCFSPGSLLRLLVSAGDLLTLACAIGCLTVFNAVACSPGLRLWAVFPPPCGCDCEGIGIIRAGIQAALWWGMRFGFACLSCVEGCELSLQGWAGCLKRLVSHLIFWSLWPFHFLLCFPGKFGGNWQYLLSSAQGGCPCC